MRRLEEFEAEGKLKRGSPNLAEAESLKAQALDRLSDLMSIPLNEKNCSFRFESAYESLREMVQSFMAAKGYKPYSHDSIVAFGFHEKILTEFESYEFDRTRQIRNDINYRGKKVTVDETKALIAFAEQVIYRLVKLK
jgi:uncharacterized protein (UPF0332 family)